MELTRAELCELIGVGSRQVANLEKDGMPVARVDGNRKMYDGQAVQWYVAWKVREEAQRHDTGAMEAAKLRKAEADARKAAVEAARSEQSVIDTEEHLRRVRHIAEAFRSALVGLPGSWAGRILGLEREAQAQARLVDLANSELRRYQKRVEEVAPDDVEEAA